MTRFIRYSLGLMFGFFSIMAVFMIFIPEAILVTILICLLLREAHNRRKNEIFNKSL